MRPNHSESKDDGPVQGDPDHESEGGEEEKESRRRRPKGAGCCATTLQLLHRRAAPLDPESYEKREKLLSGTTQASLSLRRVMASKHYHP